MGFLRLLVFRNVEEGPPLIVLNLWVWSSAIISNKGACFLPWGLECCCFLLFFDWFCHSLLQQCFSLNGLIDPSCCCVWNRHDCHEVLERVLQCVCEVSIAIIDYISFYKWQLRWILILFLRLRADLCVYRIRLWQSNWNKYALNHWRRRVWDGSEWFLVCPMCTQHPRYILL